MNIWSFFEVCNEDETKAHCTLCNMVLARGGTKSRDWGTSNLNRHLKRNHGSAHEKLLSHKEEKKQKAEKRKMEEDDKFAPIFNVRSKKLREELVSNTITDWAKPTKKLEFYSVEAQRIHKSLFETMVLDLQPFTIVNDPGIIRHHSILMQPLSHIGFFKCQVI